MGRQAEADARAAAWLSWPLQGLGRAAVHRQPAFPLDFEYVRVQLYGHNDSFGFPRFKRQLLAPEAQFLSKKMHFFYEYVTRKTPKKTAVTSGATVKYCQAVDTCNELLFVRYPIEFHVFNLLLIWFITVTINLQVFEISRSPLQQRDLDPSWTSFNKKHQLTVLSLLSQHNQTGLGREFSIPSPGSASA